MTLKFISSTNELDAFMSCNLVRIEFFPASKWFKVRTLSFKTHLIDGVPADLTSKIISVNNGIRQGAFETLHSFCVPIEKKCS